MRLLAISALSGRARYWVRWNLEIKIIQVRTNTGQVLDALEPGAKLLGHAKTDSFVELFKNKITKLFI